MGEDKVQELQDRAAGFAAKVAAFCERTGLASLEMLIAKFQVGSCHGYPSVILTPDRLKNAP